MQIHRRPSGAALSGRTASAPLPRSFCRCRGRGADAPGTRWSGGRRVGLGLRSPLSSAGEQRPGASDAGMEQVPVASAKAQNQGCSAHCAPGRKPHKAE
ncbi:hypothetical protein mRhiFer1_008329 [Rhinolophus ferrumequinum]|uniref:Uncharacterized protein n=1 Tax=Rhinolophus ferrumequinum TaxID=59479 RepID=A0A7J7VRI2_RHIFE|nr:hypothetical protein mRhiFer1_008329 [Rhinolophus ferrumequinum]